MRGVHAKSQRPRAGELGVLDDLPEALAGYVPLATYSVVLRLSTNPDDILDHTVSSPRGLAMKIINVEGDRLSVWHAHRQVVGDAHSAWTGIARGHAGRSEAQAERSAWDVDYLAGGLMTRSGRRTLVVGIHHLS